jgi:hypothetical protein
MLDVVAETAAANGLEALLHMDPASSCSNAIAEESIASTIRTTTNRRNQELSTEEKVAKRHLTKLLRLQSRIRKLETRLSQSVSRNDPVLEERTRVELRQALERAKELHFDLPERDKDGAYDGVREFVESIYHELRRRTIDLGRDDGGNGKPSAAGPPKIAGYRCNFGRRDDDQLSDQSHPQRSVSDEGDVGGSLTTMVLARNSKDHWNEQARELLQSMTKGTQTLDMFRNLAALVGYTRQKFIERAVLVADSLGRLLPSLSEGPGAACDACDGGAEEDLLTGGAIRILSSARRIVSLGCGPGCDLVGIVAFLASLQESRSNESFPPIVRQAVLLDWAMPQWKSILEPLRSLLVPEYVEEMIMASCDVGYGIDDETYNGEARRILRAPLSPATTASTMKGGDDNRHDVAVISYLLSETRGRWHAMLDGVMPSTKMVLLLDPTAWQLHEFRRRYRNLFAYTWLDSSMHHPDLQALEGRVGPAILLGVATCKSRD